MKKYMIICFDPDDESQKAKFFESQEEAREYLAYISTDYETQVYEYNYYLCEYVFVDDGR